MGVGLILSGVANIVFISTLSLYVCLCVASVGVRMCVWCGSEPQLHVQLLHPSPPGHHDISTTHRQVPCTLVWTSDTLVEQINLMYWWYCQICLRIISRDGVVNS